VPVPTRSPLPLSFDSALADIIDDPDAYATVLDVVTKHAPSAGQTLRTHTRWEDGLPLSVELFILPAAVQRAIDEELRERTGGGRPEPGGGAIAAG
jgi:hypothetical protein